MGVVEKILTLHVFMSLQTHIQVISLPLKNCSITNIVRTHKRTTEVLVACLVFCVCVPFVQIMWDFKSELRLKSRKIACATDSNIA